MNRKIFSWENIPILLSSTIDDYEDDKYYDFNIFIDEKTGLVFQKNIPDQSVLYKYARNSAIGNIWKEHHNFFYKFITNNIDLTNKKICEIGSGNGYLALQISKNYKIDCFEPNPSFEPSENVNIIKEIFNDNSDEKYDVIILSHTLEHIVDIDNFLSKLRNKLNKEGNIFISVPNFEKGLKYNHINIFNTEHISYFTKTSIKKILSKNYFQKSKIIDYIDHSIFVMSKLSNKNDFVSLSNQDFNDITNNINNYLVLLSEKILKTKNELSKVDNFYIFGCHAMTSIFLFLSKIDIGKIRGILDNDPLKNNCRLYGFKLKTYNPKNIEGGIVLLNGASYHEEIKKDLLLYKFKIIEWK